MWRTLDLPAWLGISVILVLSGLLLAVGAALGLLYCEARRVSEFQQLARVTDSGLTVATRCMETLQEITPGAIIQARNTRPRAVPVEVRDSLRARRWVTP